MAKDTKILLHVDDSEVVGDCINGSVYILPPGEPVEIDSFIADAILEHKGGIHGIVEVAQTRTKKGVEYNIEEALKQAAVMLESCENQSINFYVRQQMEDRIATGKPALPPSGRCKLIVKKRKISLRDEYGLQPIGYKDEHAQKPNTGSGGEDGKQSEAVKLLQVQLQHQREQNEELRLRHEQQLQTTAQLQKQFAELMATLNPPDDGPDPKTEVVNK